MVYALEDNIPLNYRDIIMQTTEKKIQGENVILLIIT